MAELWLFWTQRKQEMSSLKLNFSLQAGQSLGKNPKNISKRKFGYNSALRLTLATQLRVAVRKSSGLSSVIWNFQIGREVPDSQLLSGKLWLKTYLWLGLRPEYQNLTVKIVFFLLGRGVVICTQIDVIKCS